MRLLEIFKLFRWIMLCGSLDLLGSAGSHLSLCVPAGAQHVHSSIQAAGSTACNVCLWLCSLCHLIHHPYRDFQQCPQSPLHVSSRRNTAISKECKRYFQGAVAVFLNFILTAGKFSQVHFLIVSATVRNHWQSSSTEPQLENLAASPTQEDFATVASREGMMGQTSRQSQAAASRAPEILTLLTGAADAEARTGSSSAADFLTSPVGHLPDSATALTSQSSTFGELVLMEAHFIHLCPV